MKKLTFIAFIFILLTQLISAQEYSQRGRWGMQGDKIAELEKIKLIEELNLDEETTLKFFSRRNLHHEEQKKIIEKRDSLLFILSKETENDDSNHNYKDAINKILNIEKELFNGRINFFNSLDDILSSEQIAKLLIFEKKFRSEIRRQILKHGKGRMGRNQRLN